jgi:hypothetical protein
MTGHEKKLHEVEALLTSILPGSTWSADGCIMSPGAGLYDFEMYQDYYSKKSVLTFGFRSWDDFPLYKLRTYLDYVVKEVGGYLDTRAYAYEGDRPPGRRGGGRKSFQWVDIFVDVK